MDAVKTGHFTELVELLKNSLITDKNGVEVLRIMLDQLKNEAGETPGCDRTAPRSPKKQAVTGGRSPPLSKKQSVRIPKPLMTTGPARTGHSISLSGRS